MAAKPDLADKRYALGLVKEWADKEREAHDRRLDAVWYASDFASCVEIAIAGKYTRQGVAKMLEKYEESLDNSVDKS